MYKSEEGIVKLLARQETGTMSKIMDIVEEASRQIPVVADLDVLVCGSGPAGVSAAIQAARSGAKTGLLEVHGCLGGIWTSGLLAYVLDAGKPEGLLPEIVVRLKERQAWQPRGEPNFTHDPEQMKLLLEEMCEDAGVKIQLHTRVVAAQVTAGRLSSVITESKSGRQAWRAKVFIDCTGDGDLGALAGCGYSLGRGPDQETQPMSMLALITGFDPELTREFYDVSNHERAKQLCHEMQLGGHSPSYTSPGLFYINDHLCALMANHHYLIHPDDAQGITAATIRGRREVDQAVRALRTRGKAWENLCVVATAEQIGVREGRRIHGLETVVAEDLVAGRQRPDSVCRAKFAMDVHSLNPAVSKGFDRSGNRPVKPYDIPYGALVARDVQGLLMAGRCISGDFLAHSSYRITGNAVPMGEAAGAAAAFCAAHDKLPHELRWPLG